LSRSKHTHVDVTQKLTYCLDSVRRRNDGDFDLVAPASSHLEQMTISPRLLRCVCEEEQKEPRAAS
jgi:hypothetical protein